MWNGYDARLVDARGAKRCGIEHVIGRMVGRGVLLDVARHKGASCLEDGYPITTADLDATAKAQGVEVRRGDFWFLLGGNGWQDKPMPGNEFLVACDIEPAARWMWFDWEAERTTGSPFMWPGGSANVTKDFLIFRLGADQVPRKPPA